VSQLAHREGKRVMEMWLCHDSDAAIILQARGWKMIEHPDRLKVTARSFDPSIDANATLHRLYLTMGDSDLV
jgi:hypothetical protein